VVLAHLLAIGPFKGFYAQRFVALLGHNVQWAAIGFLDKGVRRVGMDGHGKMFFLLGRDGCSRRSRLLGDRGRFCFGCRNRYPFRTGRTFDLRTGAAGIDFQFLFTIWTFEGEVHN
jgi:hypothetical protein